MYDTKIGQFLKDLETKYGYDEYTNLALYLLFEIGQANSAYQAYLSNDFF